jgi:hypothetical protein
VNTAAPAPDWPTVGQAEQRVREIQTKLHRWASEDPDRRFHDVFNLVHDPAFLVVAWDRVRGNRGARSAGVDGASAFYVEQRFGVHPCLTDLRAQLRRPALLGSGRQGQHRQRVPAGEIGAERGQRRWEVLAQHRAQRVGLPLPGPHQVLVGAGQHLDLLGNL